MSSLDDQILLIHDSIHGNKDLIDANKEYFEDEMKKVIKRLSLYI